MADPDDSARRGLPRRRPDFAAADLVPRPPPQPPRTIGIHHGSPPRTIGIHHGSPPRTIGIHHGSPPPTGPHSLHPPAGERPCEVVGEWEAIQLPEDVASAPPLEALSENLTNEITYLVESQSEGSSENLKQRIPEVLKGMSDFLRINITAQPSALEQSLLVMILFHVSREIYLYNLENSVLEGPVADNIDMIMSEFQKSTFYSVPLDGKVATALHSGDVYCKMRQKWDKVPQLISMVEDLRKSPSFCNPKEVNKVHSLGEKKDVIEMSEFVLKNILSDLEERRCCRKYFPPATSEIGWYRQIRLWVNSILIFLKAKDAWLQNWNSRRKPNAVNADQLVVETVRKCSIGWEYILPKTCLSDTSLDALAPRGYKIALIFDMLPEIRFLLSECKRSFWEIVQRCSERKSPAISITSEFCREAERKRKFCHVGQEHDVEKRRKDSDAVDVSDTISKSRITRREILVQILCVFGLMKKSSFSESLSTIELRLYSRIMEHVISRMWLFDRMADVKEKLQHAVYVDKLYEEMKGERNHPSLYAVQTPSSLKRDSREQYLDLISSLVCEIEKEFSFSTPNAEDMILYEKIRGGMDANLMDPLLGGSTSGATKETCDFNLASLALQATLAREVAIANDLGGAFEEMVNTIWPGLGGTQLKLDMKEARKTVNNLAQLAGCHVYDSLLLTLYEVDQLLGSVFSRLNEANLQVEAAQKARLYNVPVVEALRALKVAGTSSAV